MGEDLSAYSNQLFGTQRDLQFTRDLPKTPARGTYTFPREFSGRRRGWFYGGMESQAQPRANGRGRSKKGSKNGSKGKAAAEQIRVWTIEKVKTCNKCVILVTTTSWGKSCICFPLAVMSERDSQWIHCPAAEDLINYMKVARGSRVPSSDVEQLRYHEDVLSQFQTVWWAALQLPNVFCTLSQVCVVPHQVLV